EEDGRGRPDLQELDDEIDDEPGPNQVEQWRRLQIEGLDEARALLAERGIDERNVEYAFADYAVPRAEAIAEEASAGGYDAVILPRGYLCEAELGSESEPPTEIPTALGELGEVRVLVV